ncbi:HTH-type transcriptional repressor yvoA [Dermatophilus congolensis]|uniref:HTH-type transcriptional repressor yvoA n=1 Tax=Dermatophilus congolensis TaxID=1863 RepID=A0A239V753_9MICO|nr:GntR family transcriptional regulator [Dermatophilus congolensis]SNV17836.1 HTH-type transcriptional repressor yvoA [Dermatophilus congolensis]
MKVPKYYWVKTEIIEYMRELVAGDAIPGERELAQLFGTSRTTVRQAIAELVVEGRLQRRQGRGTFVSPPKVMRVRQLTSFSEDLRSEGSMPGAVIVAVGEVAAQGEVCEQLGVASGAPVMRVERVRTAAGQPLAHETAFLPGPLPGLGEALEGGGSLYLTLEERFSRVIATVEDVVETSFASPREADLLTVETGSPLLLVHRTGWGADGAPVEWTRSVFRGDRFRYVARQQVSL